MVPLFPRWSNTVFRSALAAIAVGLAAGPTALWAWERTPYVSGMDDPAPQPVKFDHRHHVRDDGIDCAFCHGDAFRAPSAGVPATSLCMGCHAQVWTKSPELAPVRASYMEGHPISWRRISRLPDFVFFDHSIHLAKGVGCVSCHGRVDEMPAVRAVAPFTMDFCLDCHRDPDANLRPPSEVTNMEWRPPDGRTALDVGREIRAKLDVHPPTDCTGCHR